VSVTVITGAGGGMGLACVERFRESNLLLVDIDDHALESARRLAPEATTAVADLGSGASIDALVRQVQVSGGFDRLIHLAGVSPMMDDAERILQVDLVGTAALLGGLEKTATDGSVAICIASIAAYLISVSPNVEAVLDEPLAPDVPSRLELALGSPLNPGTAYALAKHGVVRLCERSAANWGSRGARILSLSPGLIDTPMGRLELKDNPGKRGLVGRTPIGAPRDGGSAELPGRPEHIADVIEFLAGPRARFVSGCDVRVDGGLVAALTTVYPPRGSSVADRQMSAEG
jgi:NAD(P)-dependent dehydrogenase (short-subunit alcohol dehydrogenase family)